MPDSPSIRSRLARRFDPAELGATKRSWVRHSIAEDARDIEGLLATLAADCVVEPVVETNLVCVDRRRQWKYARNVSHSPAVLMAVSTVTAPARWIRRRTTR